METVPSANAVYSITEMELSKAEPTDLRQTDTAQPSKATDPEIGPGEGRQNSTHRSPR